MDCNLLLRIVLVCLLWATGAEASPTYLTYQGRIVKSDGNPLEHSSVSFQFEILNPSGSCVLYREQVNGVNMVHSKGLFDVRIGTSHSYPASASFTILDAFDNLSTSLVCDGGTPYTPGVSEGRMLRVQFHDGKDWQIISPDSQIRSVPYAGFAMSAQKLGTKSASDFVLKPAVCAAGQVITFDGVSFNCANSGGGGGGSVTGVTSGNAYLTVANPTTAPVLTVNVGTGANTVAAGNDARFTDARPPTGTAGGDLSGTYPNPTVAKIQGRAVDSGAPSTGQVLLWNGSSWKADNVRMQDVRNSWGGTAMIPSTTCAVNEAMVWSVITDRFTCQAIAINASAITAGTINSTRLGTGTADNTTYLRGDGTWAAVPSVTETDPKVGANTTDYLSKWNGTALVSSGVIENSGNIGIGTGSPDAKLSIVDNTVSATLRLRNTAAAFSSAIGFRDAANTSKGYLEWANSGYAGGVGGANSMSLFTAAADPLALGTNGVARMTITGTGNVGVGVTTPVDKFEVAGKIRATHVCAADGTNCKDLTTSWGSGGSVTSVATGTGLTGGPITTSGTISIAAGGVSATELASNAVTTAKILDGNVTGVKLEDVSGLTAGSYGSATSVPAITIDAKGRVTSVTTNSISGLLPAASGSNGKYLKSDGTNWAGADIKFSDIKNGTGTSAFNIGSCAANQTVKWSSLTDMFECQNIGSVDAAAITTGVLGTARLGTGTADNTKYLRGDGIWAAPSITETDPKVGANTTNYISKWNGSALVASGVYESGGNVGIGTSSPGSQLAILGNAGNTPQLSIANSSTAALAYTQMAFYGGRQWNIGVGNSSETGYNVAGKFYIWDNNASAMRMAIDSSGKVGIGTTTPSSELSLDGSAARTIAMEKNGTANSNGNNLTIKAGGSSAGSSNKNGGDLILAAGDSTGDANWVGSKVLIQGTMSGTAGNTNVVTPTTVASFGYNSLYPVVAIGGQPADNAPLTLSFDGLTSQTYVTSGGTTDHLSSTEVPGFRTINSSWGDGLYTYVELSATNTDGNSQNAYIAAVTKAGAGIHTPDMVFGSSSSGTTHSEKMRIDYVGNVGIGTATPGAKLEVAGQVKITGGTPGAGKVLTSDAAGLATWQTPAAGGSGTVTSIATGSGLTGGPITTSGTISLEDVSGLTPGAYGSATAIPAITVDAKGRITAVSTNSVTGLPAAAGANGKYLKSDGTSWAGADVKFSDIKNAVGGSAFNVGSCAANQTVAWSSLTDSFTCQNIGSLDGSTITAGTIGVARLGTGTADNTKYLRGDGTWQTVSVTESDPKVGSNTTNYLSKWNGSALVTSQVFDNGTSVGVATSSPASGFALDVNGPINSNYKLEINREGNSALVLLQSYRDATNHSKVQMRAARGTASVPALISSGDIIGELRYDAWTSGSTFSNAANIQAVAEATHTATSIPTKLEFYTTASGATSSSTPAMVIGSDSNVTANGSMRVAGQISTGSQSLTTGSVDWNSGNTAKTSYDCSGNISFANIRDGGTYTLVVTNTGTTQCSFSTTTTGSDAGTVSYRFKPANAARTASTYTVYTLLRVGNEILVSWTSGF